MLVDSDWYEYRKVVGPEKMRVKSSQMSERVLNQKLVSQVCMNNCGLFISYYLPLQMPRHTQGI
jgi:hypothetical protein